LAKNNHIIFSVFHFTDCHPLDLGAAGQQTLARETGALGARLDGAAVSRHRSDKTVGVPVAQEPGAH
jgi:hypothetical protein